MTLSLQQRQVLSLLHDEIQCVTVSGLALRLGVSRSQAAELLHHAAKTSGRNYEAGYIVRRDEEKNGVSCTVFRRVTETYQPDTTVPEKHLYSLALITKDSQHGCESLATAHERDMAHFRDMVTDNKLASVISESARFDLIAPDEKVRSDLQQGQQKAIAQNVDAMEVEGTATTASALARGGGPKKVTTAASFFNSKPSGSSTKNSDKTSCKPTKQLETISITSKPEEKENAGFVTKAAISEGSSKVGHVDDLLGDEETDDEDIVETKERLKPQSIRMERSDNSVGQKSKVRPAGKSGCNYQSKTIVDSDDSDEDGQSASHSETTGTNEVEKNRRDKVVRPGALDAYATKKETVEPPSNSVKPKRRRKKFVEKTTMDASGYLHTETQEVWEDVPTDEDEPKVVKSVPKINDSKPAKKNTASMKQGSLMGFFNKKK